MSTHDTRRGARHAAIGIEHRHAMIGIAVGYEQFVGLRMDPTESVGLGKPAASAGISLRHPRGTPTQRRDASGLIRGRRALATATAGSTRHLRSRLALISTAPIEMEHQ